MGLATFGVLLAAAVVGAVAIYVTPSEESTTVEQAETGDGVVVDEDGEAYAAGLRSGDVLLSVNGKPMADSLRQPGVSFEFSGDYGEAKRVRIRRGGAVREVTVVMGGREVENARALGLSAATVERVLGGVWYAALLAFVAVAVGLFARARGRGYLASLARAMLVFAGAVGLGSGAGAVYDAVPEAVGTAVAVLLFVLIASALPSLVSALVRFPDGRYAPRWTRRAGWLSLGAVVLAIAFMAVTDLADVEVPERARLVAIMAGVLSALAVPVAGLVQKYRGATDAIVRQQMKWVILPLGAFLLLTALDASREIAAPTFDARGSVAGYVYGQVSEALAALTALAVPLGVLAGVLGFRPWDADLWIGRSVALGAATLGLGAVFAGASEALRLGMMASMGEGGQVAAAAAAAVLTAVLFNPVRERVQAWIERDRRRRRRVLTRSVPRLLGGRQTVAPPDALAALALGRVREALETEEAAVFAWDDGVLRPLAVDRVTAAAAAAWAATLDAGWADVDGACQQWGREPFVLYVPLQTVDGDLVGALALGPHGRRGRGYSTDEQAALVVVAEALAEALLVAQTREAERAEGRDALRDLVERFERVAGQGDGAGGVVEPRP